MEGSEIKVNPTTVSDIIDSPEQRYRNIIDDLRLNVVRLDSNVDSWFDQRSIDELSSSIGEITSGLGKIVDLHSQIDMNTVRQLQKEKKEKKGGFNKRIVLVEDLDGKDHPDLPKLVRDGIPGQIEISKVSYKARVAEKQEMPGLLSKKIREELEELTKSGGDEEVIGEIVDMLECVDQLKKEINASPMGYGKGTGLRGFMRFIFR